MSTEEAVHSSLSERRTRQSECSTIVRRKTKNSEAKMAKKLTTKTACKSITKHQPQSPATRRPIDPVSDESQQRKRQARQWRLPVVKAHFNRKERNAVVLLRRVLPPRLGRRRRRPVTLRNRRCLDTKQTAKRQPTTRGVGRLLRRRYLLRVSLSREMVARGRCSTSTSTTSEINEHHCRAAHRSLTQGSSPA